MLVAVLGGASLFYFGTKKSNNTPATGNTTTPTSTGNTTTPTPTGNTTTPTPTGNTTMSSSAAAAVSGLAPFVGRWTTHVGILVIRQTGSGHMAYTDHRACPSCSSADALRVRVS